jgi:hypothetical protein
MLVKWDHIAPTLFLGSKAVKICKYFITGDWITASPLKNYVIINGLLPAGVQGSYYRRVGPLAIGGGLQYQKPVGIHAGILYAF